MADSKKDQMIAELRKQVTDRNVSVDTFKSNIKKAGLLTDALKK